MPLLDESFLSKLDVLSIVTRRPVHGQLRGAHRSRRTGAGMVFTDFRPYSAGDDIRQLAAEMLDDAKDEDVSVNAATVILSSPATKAQDFVDVLKKPTCIGKCIGAVLKLAEARLGAKSDGNPWAFAKWSAAQKLDLTSPPRRSH